MSVFSKTSSDLPILSSPSSPTSSRPAVSIRTQGPIGRISIGLNTGSVVVPAISETIAALWFVIAFIMLDLPAFLLPKRPICTLTDCGVEFRLICTHHLKLLFLIY